MSNKTCLALVALGLLAIVAACLLLFPAVQQQALLRALQSLVVWLPVLYGMAAPSCTTRYWRWRLLLGRLGIGTASGPDLLSWFRRFALTATPAKPGELIRVQLLHEQLACPRLPRCTHSSPSGPPPCRAGSLCRWRCCGD
jgi:hypothetical protein